MKLIIEAINGWVLVDTIDKPDGVGLWLEVTDDRYTKDHWKSKGEYYEVQRTQIDKLIERLRRS